MVKLRKFFPYLKNSKTLGETPKQKLTFAALAEASYVQQRVLVSAGHLQVLLIIQVPPDFNDVI